MKMCTKISTMQNVNILLFVRSLSLTYGTVQGRHLEGRKYRIQKVCRFWRIGVCVADSDILHIFNTRQFWDHTL